MYFASFFLSLWRIINIFSKLRLDFFMARRLVAGANNDNKGVDSPFVRIATAAVALSVFVMIVSMSVIIGFRNEIMQKVVGFGSCINIINRESALNLESMPISSNQDFFPSMENEDGISHIQRYAYKPAIFKSGSDIMGVVLKGVGSEYDFSFIESNIVDGRVDISANEQNGRRSIVISRKMADLLGIKVGDDLVSYFVQNPPRMRKFTVSGIYSTGLEESDKMFAYISIDEIQKLNGWQSDQITGFEVMIDDFDRLDEMTELVRSIAGYTIAEDGSMMRVLSVRDTNGQLFSWIALIEMNVWVILGIMFFVALVNMSTALLIIIFEKSSMIGLLKSLGASNWLIRRVFILQSLYVLFRGVVIGSGMALVLILVQHYFNLIPLDASSYYVDHVPCELQLWYFVAIDLAVIIGMSLMLIIPSMAVSRMEPAKVLKFK